MRLGGSGYARRDELLVFEAPGFESGAMHGTRGGEAGGDDGCELRRESHGEIRCRPVATSGGADFLRLCNRAA